jgi:serine/threonine-protein kinase
VAQVTGGLGLFLLGVGVTWLWRPPSPPHPLTRVTLDVRPAEALYGGVAMASIRQPTPGGSRTAFTWTPDGRSLVYVGLRDGVRQVYVRRLDAAEARPVAGTEGAQSPAVSADGRWVAFWSRYAIRKVALDGGPVAELTPRVRPPRGLVWDDRGNLFFGNREDGCIWKVPPEGTPAAVTSRAEGEFSHTLPWPLPGATVLLYTVRKRSWSWGDEEVVAQPMGATTRTILLRDAVDARYVASGHVVFLRRGVLFAVPFDARRVEVGGTPVAVLDGVVQALTGENDADVTGAGQFAAASTGTLAWVPGAVVPYAQAALVTVDRRGQVTPLRVDRLSYGPIVRLSPDGRRLATTAKSVTECALRVCDLERGTQTLVNRDGEFDQLLWSPDGQHIAFTWLKDGRTSLAVQPLDGGAPRVLAEGNIIPSSWTRDGRQILAVQNTTDIVSVTVEAGNARVQPLMRRPDNEFSGGRTFPELSPDGHWLAYVSTATGREELFIRPYPGSGSSQPVSPEGGTNPIWHPNGRELFFGTPWKRGELQRMMAADVATGPSLRLGRVRSLFTFDTRDVAFDCAEVRCADVSPDGQRFYAVQYSTPPPAPVVTHVNLIQNWFEELKAKVPVK